MGLVESSRKETIQPRSSATDRLTDIFDSTPCTGEYRGRSHRIRHNPTTNVRMCVRCNLTDAPLLPNAAIREVNRVWHVAGERSHNKRLKIAERDGFKGCRYCGYSTISLSSLTIEHIDSQHAGGSSLIGNLGLSCTQCNNIKGAMTEEEYVLWLLCRVIPKRIPVEAQVTLRRQEAKRRASAAAFLELLEYLRELGSPLHRHLHSPGTMNVSS